MEVGANVFSSLQMERPRASGRHTQGHMVDPASPLPGVVGAVGSQPPPHSSPAHLGWGTMN